MFTLAVFAMGLLCGSLGVFTLIILEAVVCGAVFFSFWSEGFAEALQTSVETGAVITGGFICALTAVYVLAKFRFWPAAWRRQNEVGLLSVDASRDTELIRICLARLGDGSHQN
jgi:uncharacterized membrane protein